MAKLRFKAFPAYQTPDGQKHPATKATEIEEPTPEELQEFSEPEPSPPTGDRPSGVAFSLNKLFGSELSRAWDRYLTVHADWEMRRAQHQLARQNALERQEAIEQHRAVESNWQAAAEEVSRQKEVEQKLLEMQLCSDGVERAIALRFAHVWRKMDPLSFEANVAWLYRASGWQAELTQITGDGGVDVIARRDERMIVIQCKAHRQPQGSPVVRELVGARHVFGAQDAALCTLNGVTPEGQSLADSQGIRIFTAEGLARWAEEIIEAQDRSRQSES